MVEKSSEVNEEYRKLQTFGDNRTFFVGIPKVFVSELGLQRNEYLKIQLDGRRLVIERVNQ